MSMDASVKLLVGMRGMGKTTLARSLIKPLRHPVVVFDPTDQWAKELKVQPEYSMDGMNARMHRYWRAPFRAVYVPPPGRYPEMLHVLCSCITQLQAGYHAGDHDRQITLVVEEANLSYPKHELPSNMQNFTAAILQGRMHGINIIAITQRPALVHPNYRDNTEETYCLALGGNTSIKAMLDVVGPEHRKSIQSLQKFEYMHFSLGSAERGQVKP